MCLTSCPYWFGLGCFENEKKLLREEMQLILNMKILLRQEVKPVSNPSPFRINVRVPCLKFHDFVPVAPPSVKTDSLNLTF